MQLCVSLWLALITLSCCGHVACEKEELTTASYDGYSTMTLMVDYYDYAGDYSDIPETESYIPNKASWTGQLNLVFLLGLLLHQIWT